MDCVVYSRFSLCISCYNKYNESYNDAYRARSELVRKEIKVVDVDTFTDKVDEFYDPREEPDEDFVSKSPPKGELSMKLRQRNRLGFAKDSFQWVCCDDCKKWRKAPLEDDWTKKPFVCSMNTWDVTFADCNVPQDDEAEESDDEELSDDGEEEAFEENGEAFSEEDNDEELEKAKKMTRRIASKRRRASKARSASKRPKKLGASKASRRSTWKPRSHTSDNEFDDGKSCKILGNSKFYYY